MACGNYADEVSLMASVILRQDVLESWEDMSEPNRTFVKANLVKLMLASSNLQVISNMEDIVECVAR